MPEKRTSERRKFNEPVEIATSAAGTGRDIGLHCRASGVDICPYGLGLITGYPLVRGMVLRLALRAAGTDNMLPVFAEVAWVDALEDRFRAGLRFLM